MHTAAVPPDQQRYLMYNFYNAGYDGDPNFNWSPIETALKNGFNGIMLTVPWDQIYPTRNSPGNWATLDKQVARIIELGGKIGFLIGIQRDLDRVDSFWPADGYARTYKNEILYKNHAFQFSPAYQPTLDLATDFVRQVAQRYNSQQQQGNILFVSVVNSPIMEQEYSSTSQILYQASESLTVLDYSKAMIAGFQQWLPSRYSSVGAMNTAWGSNYASFGDAMPPGMNGSDVYTAFVGKIGKDWYAYRHKVHKALVEQTTQAIKSVNNSYKVINQHGSVYDNLSLFRGTLGFKNYALNVDGVKVNDAPSYIHGFSMDLLRSNLGPDKWVMNELDGIDYARVGLNTYVNQTTESFAHGAKVVTFSNFADASGIDFARQIVQQVRAQGWLDQPVPAFVPSGTISVKLSQLVDAGGYSSIGIPYQWLQIYNQNGNQPVRITIDEDILDTTTTTPPSSTTTAVSSLSLLAPAVDCATGLLTFKTAGGDGTPIDFMAVGLVSWSPVTTAFIQPFQRTGVTFALKARQSGSIVSYQYTTNCPIPTTTPANQPPVLVTPIASQTIALAQSYSFAIPAATFSDPDGQIVSWAVTGLPASLTYNAATQTIGGTPSGIGTWVITVVVTDNGGATAQTTFTIKVVAKAPPATVTPPTPTTPTAFSIIAPSLDCATGILTFRTTGGNGSPIDYLLVGYTNWSGSNTIYLDPSQRTGTTFRLAVRQGSQQLLYSYLTNCAGTAPTPVNQPPVVVTPIASQTATLARSYSFAIPAATFSDPDGQLVSWVASNLPVGLTFDSTTHIISGTPSLIGPNTITIKVTDNGGASVQTTFILQVLGNAVLPTTPPVSASLTMLAPAFNCVTGKLIFRSSGGDGTPIEYLAVGIKIWSADSTGIIAPWQRDGVTFSLQARQSGKQVSYSFTTSCSTNKPPVVVTPIASQTATLARSYSFAIPAATFSDPDGQIVSWAASNLPVGLTFDASTHTISGTPSLIGPNVVTITVTDNGGASVQATFILQVLGNNATPVTPPASASLTMLAPAFDCVTGKIIFRSSGGDNTPVEYFAVGIKIWSVDSTGIIAPWQRDGVTFSLQARQSGKQVSYSFTTSCSTNKPPVVVTPIASQTATLARSYSFAIPAATFSDPDGQIVSWAASNLPVGLTFDASTHTISGTPSLIGPNVVTVTVTDNSGASVQATFVVQVLGNTTTAAAPVSPLALSLIAPGFDCVTGKLIFRSSGGDGTPVEYFATGIKVWGTDSVGYVASWQRDAVTFTLQARQSGKTINFFFKTACTTAPVATTPVSATTAPGPIPASSTLVLVSPQNRIVYQRNQSNQANVSVVGQAPGTATRAEARLVPVVAGQGTLLDWTDLPLSAAKTFATPLTNTGGWYRLEVRAWNGSTQLGQQTIDRVGIGEVFVVAGQSNAYGGFEVRPGAQDDRVSCLDYKDDNLYEASLPVQFSHMDISVSVGPNNPKHIWPELGDKLASRLNVPVLFLGAAQSGTGSDQWRQSIDGSGTPFPDNLPYRRLGATILHYIARTGARAVLWHQGEGDQNRTSTQDYVNNLTVVINKSRSQSSNSVLPWVVSRASYVYGVTDQTIISAQNRLTNEVPQVYPGPYTDVLGAAFRPIDNVHLSGPGATSFIDLWDQSLSNDFFSRSTPFSVNSSPQITTGYTLTGTHLAGQTIKVPYVVSGNPDATSSFSVQLIRDSDGSVVTTVGSGRDNPMTVTLPGNLANGMYRAKVVAANLTALAGEPFLVGPVGGRVAAPETQAGSWQTWPNPAEHDLTIAMPTTVTATKLRIVLRTVSGQMPASVIESTPVENGQVHLTLPTLQTGMYFLQIYDGEQPLQTLKILRK